MRKAMFETKNTVKRFATVLATMVGLVFAFVGSAAAVPVDKMMEMEKQEVAEKFMKPEMKSDSKAFFDRDRFNNRNFFFDRERVFDRRPFFNDDFRRPFFFNDFEDFNFEDKDDD